MITGVRKEVSATLTEQACSASVLLAQDDLIEQFDARIFWLRAFALVNELIECLRLLKHVQVIASIMRQRMLEAIPVELPQHALLLLLGACWPEVATVGIQ